MSEKGLKFWADKLSRQHCPVMGEVIAELNKITGTDDSNVNQLAEVILRDPNLTSRVLKVANSVHYNHVHQQINTVSRAIVHLGMKGVRAICISSLMMETLLKDQPQARVMALIAQGFHAATQARSLIHAQSGEDGEDVFIAALLFNIGEMVFWTTASGDIHDPDLFDEAPKVRQEAMQRHLGTSFKAITLELARYWRLNDTLVEALSPTSEPSAAAKAVIIAERLSRASLYGWESEQMRKVLGEVAEFNGMSLAEALSSVREGGDKAAQVALSYGVPQACPLIPSSVEDVILDRRSTGNRGMRGDPSLQLRILRDLSSATEEGLDVNTIFSMVLEGMHRGIGLERVCIAFVKNHRLEAKYALGDETDQWREKFRFDVGPFTESFLVESIEAGGSHWISDSEVKKHPERYPIDIVSLLGKTPCFLHIIEVDRRKVAVFYADRGRSGGVLGENQFESFRHFCQQAQMSLNHLSQQRLKPHKPVVPISRG